MTLAVEALLSPVKSHVPGSDLEAVIVAELCSRDGQSPHSCTSLALKPCRPEAHEKQPRLVDQCNGTFSGKQMKTGFSWKTF